MVVDGCKKCVWVIILVLFSFNQSIAQQDTSQTTVKVLSWNIQMLPNAMGMFSAALRKKQRQRLPWIVAHCEQNDYEVIVFQEVFDVNIKRKLAKALKKTYPHQVNTKIAKGRITSNGILIVSKLPMRYLDHVIYQKGAHEDGWAAKGCTLVEIDKNNKKIQIAGTHLQAGSSEEAQKHRASQYLEIKSLLDANEVEKRPVLVVGDMNTAKANTTKYQLMLESIDLIDFELEEERPYTIDPNNSWNRGEQPKQLDYILLQKRNTNTTIQNLKIIRPTQLYKGVKMDLADHYGVVGEVVLE